MLGGYTLITESTFIKLYRAGIICQPKRELESRNSGQVIGLYLWISAMDVSFLSIGVLGTVAIWFYSAFLSLIIAVSLYHGSLSWHPAVFYASRFFIQLGRGIPTSIFVISAGIISMPLLPASDLPKILPGTLPTFQMVGLAIIVALAFGSAGHLAEILLAGHRSIGRERLAQMQLMGLRWVDRVNLVFRESAGQIMPAITARLVHHLHNIAFAALFPIVELFGVVQSGINRSFEVVLWIGVGVGIYILLSVTITAAGSALQYRFASLRRQPLGGIVS